MRWREHDLGQRLHVVGQGVVAAAQQGASLGRAQQQQAGARAGPELGARVLARAVQQRDDIAAQGVGGVHAARRVLDGQQLGRRGHRLEHVDAVGDLVGAEHGDLARRRRIAHRHARHEAVDLRLGQRVGALELDRVLRGQHDERARQLVRVHVDGHAPLLHALEQDPTASWATRG
jgi:hypothetical protein